MIYPNVHSVEVDVDWDSAEVGLKREVWYLIYPNVHSVEVDVDWDSAEVGLKREEVRNLVDSNHGDEFRHTVVKQNKVLNSVCSMIKTLLS